MKEVDWLLTVFLVLSWHTASASTNARVYQISTKMNGNYRTNGASMAGGTLLYIQGQGFAPEEMSTSETAATSNYVVLNTDFSSYECDIHRDMTSTSQIACYTRKMPQGDYFVRVFVKGDPIPDSQYSDLRKAVVRINSGSTPSIRSVTPQNGIPGTLITIDGDFKTYCIDRSKLMCANEYDTRITRVYFGPQQCQLGDAVTGELFRNVTRYSMGCKLAKPEIGYFLGSILVSNQYGLSVTDRRTVHVAPDETIYNFQTYAEIDEVTPKNGSLVGGTLVTITGKYLYTDSHVPADVRIGDRNCHITDFNMDDQLRTRIQCRSDIEDQTSSAYYGNRGVTLYRTDNFSPSLDAVRPLNSTGYLDQMSYTTDTASTVWLIGYLRPGKNSSYTFSISTSSSAKLFISSSVDSSDKNLIATHSSSGSLNLEADNEYYIELVASKSSGFQVGVSAKLRDTRVTEEMSGYANNQHAEIEISSTALPEAYTLTFEDFEMPNVTNGMNGTNGTNGTNEINEINGSEIQLLTVMNITEGYYMLQFQDLTTSLISSNASAIEILEALNDIPYLQPDLVLSVNESYVYDGNDTVGKNYTIIFSEDLGDIDELTVIGNVTADVTELSTGQGQNKFQVSLNGMRSGFFDLTDSALSIKAVLGEMFDVRCPSSINKRIEDKVVFINDFESSGCNTKDANATAFCGKCSRVNDGNLVHNLNSSLEYNTICFAYKTSTAITRLYFQVVDAYEMVTDEDYVQIQTTADNSWHYLCGDIYGAYTFTSQDRSAPKELKLFQASVWPYNENTYIDTISIRKQKPPSYDDPSLITTRRAIPTFQYAPETFTVTKSKVDITNTINVSFKTSECLSNLVPMDFIGFQDIAAVTQTSLASPRVTGTFDLTWNGHTLSNIEADIEADDLTLMLEALEGFGNVKIVRSKDCSGFKWYMIWPEGGEKLPVEISGNSLVGDDITIEARTVKSGGVTFNPVPGLMLRTFHEKPQVTVLVAGLLSKCTGDCTFDWTEESTPTVDSIDTSDLNAIILTGTKFESNPMENVVLIGDVPCTITLATETHLTCAAGINSIGTYNFTVNVLGKGLAVMNAQADVTFHLNASSMNPVRSSTGGGVLLTINGTGFSVNTEVSVDGNHCRKVSSTYRMIECIVPPSDTPVNKEVDVVVSEQSEDSMVPIKFLYDFESTPMVTMLAPSVLKVEGGLVNATGTNLPLWPTVRVGERSVRVVYSDAQVLIFEAPSMPAGLQEVSIKDEISGYAHVNTPLEYQLYVSSFGPRSSSIQGGSLVTIYGEGFSSKCDENKVNFGLGNCRITNCTDTWIQCQAPSAYVTHEVNNDAMDPYYGKGYAWSQPHLNIATGDSVHWSWRTPTGVTGVKFQVLQAENSMRKNLNYGFSSGPPSVSGSFTYQFNQAGTYYYWSGYVEESLQITFRGVIVVRDVEGGKELEFDVSLHGHKALKCSFPFTYNSNTYNECTDIDSPYPSSSWCSPLNSQQKLRCNPIVNVNPGPCEGSTLTGCGMPTSNNAMLFTKCDQLPIIQSVSRNNVTVSDPITITGTGFSETECENRVFIGETECLITSSSTTELVCQLGANSRIEPYSNHPVQVSVKNFGFALKQSAEFTVQFLPIISSVTPSSGSTAGGTLITINGNGFVPDRTLILIGSNSYHSGTPGTIINNENIELRTLAESDVNRMIKVYVNNMLVKSEEFNFLFDEADTPKLVDVSPTAVNGSSLMTLSGRFLTSDPTKVNVQIGKENCDVLSVDGTELSCRLDGLSLGDQQVTVSIRGKGLATPNPSLQVAGEPIVASMTPNTGSVYGGTLVTILGNGFDLSSQVTLAGADCVVKSVSTTSLTCRTPSGNGNALLAVRTQGQLHEANLEFSYSQALSPTVTSLSSSSGGANNITIYGTGFGSEAGDLRVMLGSAGCDIISVTDTEIICALGPNEAGTSYIVVDRSDMGHSNNDISYEFELSISSLSHDEGTTGGGLQLNIDGTGFGNYSSVTICGRDCQIVQSSFTNIQCKVPPSGDNLDKDCELLVSVNGMQAQSSFRYSAALSPILSSVSPKRGGSAGGTLITITGSGFPLNQQDIMIEIADALCSIETLTSTEITCRTGSYRYSSIKAPVNVHISEKGLAVNEGNSEFEYIDLWSSKFTWGGMSPPGKGELAIITKGQHIYFDAVSTPVLKGIIIQEGSLIFDDNQDVSLDVEYLLILDGGKLQIGTEDMPFQHNVVVTMHGHVKSIELPIFGSKVIGLREGSIDMHGSSVGVTWTHLDLTSLKGSTEVTLKEPVSWPVGSEIILAPTGDKRSVGNHDQRTITSKSNGDRTLTLDRPLDWDHLSEARTVGTGSNTVTVHVRAEVGLLSRNIVFRGHNDDSWNDLYKAEACPKLPEVLAQGNQLESVIMNCFMGRYGPELGSDQFGATIMIAPGQNAPKDRETAFVRLSNVELFHVGQAFRLGRYPVHFHLCGPMPSSYVRECAIHESFNRAVNVHATNYVTIERNLIFNIWGGAFFLEAGNEIGNVFQYNLAIFVRHSSSLMNEDITPAAFWATNPNNTYLHNAVAGCSHFGFWYRLSGAAVCAPFKAFSNNTVHSSGRYGLWIFPKFQPRVSGVCSDRRPQVAEFTDFTSYSCDKALEYVHSSNVQLKRFVVWDHHTFAIETCKIDWLQNDFYEETGPMVADSTVIGNSLNAATHAVGEAGLVIATERGQSIRNIRFFNFPGKSPAIQSTNFLNVMPCDADCGGYTTRFSALEFNNVKFRANWDWDWQHILEDLDGSLTGHRPTRKRAASESVFAVSKGALTEDDPACTNDGFLDNGMTCLKSNSWIRFAFKLSSPAVGTLLFTNSRNKTARSHERMVRITYAGGHMVVLEARNEYKMHAGGSPTSNFTYTATWFSIYPGEYLILRHPLRQKPDRVNLGSYSTFESREPINTNSDNGDWYWDNTTQEVSYLIKNSGSRMVDFHNIGVNIYKCFFPNCIVPKVDTSNLTVFEPEMPDTIHMWSNVSTWKLFSEPGYAGFLGNNQYGLPKDNENIKIPADAYILIDTPLPKIRTLEIEGFLELSPNMSHYLNVQNIIIKGGQLIIGSESSPILTNVEINLSNIETTRKKRSVTFTDPPKPYQIDVHGGLIIHGKQRNVTWTKLVESARAGQNMIVLAEPVDWQVGETLMVSTTKQKGQDEKVVISEVDPQRRTLKLSAPLKFDHMTGGETFENGLNYEVTARVGLLSRNVKIISDSVENGAIVASDLVSYYKDGVLDPSVYKGYIQMSNVELSGMGREFLRITGIDGLGAAIQFQKSSYKHSYVQGCSIAEGNSAIVINDSENITIADNVIFKCKEFGIYMDGANLIATHNMFVNFVALEDPPTAGFMYNRNHTFIDNFISSADFAIETDGLDCNELVETKIANNTVYSSGYAVNVYEGNGPCISIAFYEAVFCDSGIYYHSPANFKAIGNTLIGNRKGIWSYIYGPSAGSHQFGFKLSEIERDNLIVGNPPMYPCENVERTGVLWPAFGSASIMMLPSFAPEGIQQLSGQTIISNVTFAHFNSSCNTRGFILTTNSANEDNHLPIDIGHSLLIDVDLGGRVFYHRPSRAKINPTDCVDMHCDGLKKGLITDIDGGFLGSPGTIIPQSEFGWGSNQLGLGDFRIPKEAISDENGHLIDPSLVYDEPGLIRNNSCQYRSVWQAYECHNIDHKMLTIESMDHDTMERRLSPVAILSDTKYLDLLNGPEDYGWCFGYTCQRRLSSFMAMIANGHSFDVYLTSTPPETLRFRILYASEDFKVRLSMHYFTSMRIDLYLNGEYIHPSNAIIENGHMELVAYNETTLHQYKPTVASTAGTNLYHKPDRKVYFTMDGPSIVDLKIAPVLYVRFGVPAITPEQFFNKNTVIGNFAHLLEIEPSKIRRVEIVRESRRKRSVGGTISIVLTIEEDPISSLNDTQALNASKSSMNQLDAKVSNLFITGQLQERAQLTLNVTLTELSVQKPMEQSVNAVKKLKKLKVVTQADSCAAQVPCAVQPKLMVLDEDDNVMVNIGNSEFPWVVVASVSSDANVSIILQSEVNVINGYVNFTSLGVSDVSENIRFSFNFKEPQAVNTTQFRPSPVVLNAVKATQPVLSCQQINEEISVTEGTLFSITVGLIDKNSKILIPNISWQNQTWRVVIELHTLGYYRANGSLSLTNSSAEFDPSNGVAVFSDLGISKKGMYLLTFKVISSDGAYTLNCLSKAITVTAETATQMRYSTDSAPNYTFKFEGEYDSIESDEVKANLYNFMTGYEIDVGSIQVYSGSVYVSFYSSDTNSDLVNTLISAGLTVDPNLQFSYASIDGNTVQCTNCVIATATEEEKSDSVKAVKATAATAAAIAGAVVGAICAMILIGLAFIGIREFKKIRVNNMRIGSADMKGKSKERSMRHLIKTTEYDIEKVQNSSTEPVHDIEKVENSSTEPIPVLPEPLKM